MERVFQYKITKNLDERTVEDVLKKFEYSSRIIAKLRQTKDGLQINNSTVYTTYPVSEGEILTVRLIDDDTTSHILPVHLPFEIIYEDDDILVINKPANMPIHPSHGNYENTLANAVAYYFQSKGESFVYRAINRLDRDTTGLLVLAKHMLSGGILSQMVANRKIHRQYLAIVSGNAPSIGSIEAPIARAANSTIERCIDFPKGEYAKTHFRKLETINMGDGKIFSFITLKLETGRTHQIRVHMKYIGHPLLGDFIYNPDYSHFKRQTLHSYYLSFAHPITKKQMEFYAPLPKDFVSILPDNYQLDL